MSDKKLKILIVEDEAVCAMLLVHYLAEMGHIACGIVSRGADAIEAAREMSPDVVLMDIRLTDAVNGVEAAEKIMLFNPGISFIFMSAYSGDDVALRAKGLNPVAYLCKPFEFADMREAVETVEKRMGAARE